MIEEANDSNTDVSDEEILTRDMICLGFNQSLDKLYNDNLRFASVAVVDGETKYSILDDELYGEIWIPVENGEALDIYDYLLRYRSENYNSFILEDWVEYEDGIKTEIFKLKMNNHWEVPLNIMITNTWVLENIKPGTEVLCSITCFRNSKTVSFYKSEEDYRKNNKEFVSDCLTPIKTFVLEEDDFAGLSYATISGKVKNVNIRTNLLTSAQYAHFSVSSLDMIFDVVIPLEEIPYPVNEIRYISGTYYLNGYIKTDNYKRYGDCRVDMFSCKITEDEFESKVKPYLKELRAMTDEFYIADFKNDKNFPVAYIQTIIKGDDSVDYIDAHEKKDYRIEYAKNTVGGKTKLFKLKTPNDFCDLELALEIFHTVCVDGKEPLAWDWEDISYLIKES